MIKEVVKIYKNAYLVVRFIFVFFRLEEEKLALAKESLRVYNSSGSSRADSGGSFGNYEITSSQASKLR